MEFLSEKFALKSPTSKNSDFYMGAGGALEHVMETLDNESFYSKAAAGKCVQAFGPLPRAEHHVRLERTSPCQDGSGESAAPAPAAAARLRVRSTGTRGDPRAVKEGGGQRPGAGTGKRGRAAGGLGWEGVGRVRRSGASRLPLAVQCGPRRVPGFSTQVRA